MDMAITRGPVLLGVDKSYSMAAGPLACAEKRERGCERRERGFSGVWGRWGLGARGLLVVFGAVNVVRMGGGCRQGVHFWA